ncbi:MAG: pirin family protein [Bacteroidales bacterium]|nr:pirin family protein [Bacteroidales bacterium]
MKNTIIHKANTRGFANHGWLKTHHTFSFANYYNNERVHFGMLRVLNDDWIEGGKGFGTHPHDNMEIITIPLSGAIAHKDSMGNSSVIQHGEVQVMSAGTGITHSEFNADGSMPVTILQIWVFPNQREVEPRYDQIKLDPSMRKNKLQQILSPNPDDEGVWIYQNAWFHLADMDQNLELEYPLKQKENGVYAFVIKGDITINGENLQERDGMGIWNIDKLDIKANSQAEVLLMEVPMR